MSFLKKIQSKYVRASGIQDIETKSLPVFLKSALKRRGFSKRKISVTIRNESNVPRLDHAPQFDNFDYSYADLVNVHTKISKTDLQKDVKSDYMPVSLADGDILISGDRLSKWANLYMNKKTLDSLQKVEAKYCAVQGKATTYKEKVKSKWFAAFEDAVVAIDSKYQGKIDWDGALYLFNQGISPEDAATKYTKYTAPKREWNAETSG